jgi:signal transduction histidine kinase
MQRSRVIGVLATLPVLAALGLAMDAVSTRRPRAEAACRVLPNRVVPVLASFHGGCPLDSYDRILALRRGDTTHWLASLAPLRQEAESGATSLPLLVRGPRGERWTTVPVIEEVRGQAIARLAAALILCGALLATSWSILAGSSSRAALPLHGFYCAVSVFLVYTLCGRHSLWLGIAGGMARGAIPATVAHLALTFPSERRVLRRAPGVVPALYVVAATLTLLNVINRDRSPAVWELTDRLLLLLAGAAWGLLMVGCAFARRESSSLLERSRARVLLWGCVAIPLLPLIVAAAVPGALRGGAASIVAATAALLPLPVGYAIVRHRLFDLEIHAREGVARLLGSMATSLVICAAISGVSAALGPATFPAEPALLFAAAFIGALAAEALRGRMSVAVRDWVEPSTAMLVQRSEELASRMGECVEPAGCARLLCETVAVGLDRDASVFVDDETGWHLAHAEGKSAPISSVAAERASRLTREATGVHLAREEVHREPDAVALRAEGVEFVARLRGASEDVALLIIGASRRGMALASPELRFLATVIRQAGLGIHAAQLARSEVVAERVAARGRVGAALVHDLGKPLGVIECLASRLLGQPGIPPRAASDAATIASLAVELRATLRSADPRLSPFGEGSRTGKPSRTAVDEVIDRAVQLAARSHGPDRTSLRIAPGLACLSGPVEPLIRVIANLLDNALLSSSDGDVVEVAARRDGCALEIEVIDRGIGMSPQVLGQACTPFFTTRRASGGSGLGLTICQDLLESMGGTLALESSPGRGTRARVTLPIPGPSR